MSKSETLGQSSGIGCGGCAGTIFLILLILAIVGQLAENGNTGGLFIVVVVVVAGYVIWRFRSPGTAGRAEVAPQNYEWLGNEVKVAFLELEAPIKNELRKARGATGYDVLFEMSVTDVICQFASLDGGIIAAEAKVFLDIFTVLHPKKYAGLSADDAVALLEGHRQRHPESLQVPFTDSVIFKLAQRAGEVPARDLKALMSKIGLQVALADGPLSRIEQAEIDALRGSLGATARLNEAQTVAHAPDADDAPGQSASVSESIAAVVDAQAQRPIVDPQFTCATGVVTIDVLKQKIKELVESLEPLLKEEYRRARKSSVARDLLEQDIRAIIIRLGFADGSISDYAAHLYLEIFKCLHPRTYAGWTADTARDALARILEGGRDTYLGVLKKPVTLEVLERFDSAHGTGATKPTREIFLILAAFAASTDGKLSREKETEIMQLTAAFETMPGA